MLRGAIPKCCCLTGWGGEEVPERFGEGHEEHEEQEQQEQEQQTAQSPQEEKFRQGEQSFLEFFRNWSEKDTSTGDIYRDCRLEIKKNLAEQ
jgi:hypothetical protein